MASEKALATIYGPVGWLVQKEGQRPHLRLPAQWEATEHLINRRIAEGSAFVGADRVPRLLEGQLSEAQVESLSDVLANHTDGELVLVPVGEAFQRVTP
jgi:hypothetical protein